MLAATATLSAARRVAAASCARSATVSVAAVATPSSRRTFSASASAASEPFDRPGPVPLPPKEQREFEKLVREKANSLQFNSTSKTADGEESLHPDMRRKPKPDFDGDTNPVTASRFRPSLSFPHITSTAQTPSLRAFSTSARTPNENKNDAHGSNRPRQQSKDQPPSASSDPFPLPFDPALTSSSIEGSPPPALASTSQLDGLPSFVFDQEPNPEDFNSDANASAAREVYSPMTRVPGRTPLTEDREVTIARLIYQVRKRGTLETDLLLSTFAKTELKHLTDQELLEFDTLLDEPDWDIFYWATDRKPVPPRWADSFATEGRLGWRLRKHTKNEEKVPRRMPSLE